MNWKRPASELIKPPCAQDNKNAYAKTQKGGTKSRAEYMCEYRKRRKEQGRPIQEKGGKIKILQAKIDSMQVMLQTKNQEIKQLQAVEARKYQQLEEAKARQHNLEDMLE